MQLVTPPPPTAVDRVAMDFYETPPAVTEDLVRILGPHLQPNDFVFEPCVGDGAIANVLESHGCEVWTNDLDPARPTNWHVDAGEDVDGWGRIFWKPSIRPRWVISNPPFSEIHRIIPLAHQYATLATVMLLRLSHIEPVEKRKMWWTGHPPQHRLTTQRISFRRSGKGSKTDSVTTEWAIWTASGVPLDGVPVHGFCLWKDRMHEATRETVSAQAA